jgi:hypothetical protein
MRDPKFMIGCFMICWAWTLSVLAATSTLPVDGNGNVGIGTTAPLAGLQVGTGAQAFSPTPALSTTGVLIKGNVEVDGKIYGDGSGLTGLSQWTTSGNNIYYNAGNVGIGTASPINTFEVTNYISFNATDLNTKAGYEAGKNIVSGAANNVFLGVGAGKSGSGTNAADSNTAVGYNALFANTSGSENSAVGANALYANTTGTQNVALGADGLRSNTTGAGNTAIGFQSLYSNQAVGRSTAIGTRAMYYANNTTVDSSIYGNVAVGFEALLGSSTASSNTGYNNTATGYQALWSNTAGDQNTAYGYQALYSNTIGDGLTAIGSYALHSNNAKHGLTAIGSGAMRYANSTSTSGEVYSTAVGYEALRGSDIATNNIGTSNTAIGYQALFSYTSGSTNVAVGNKALYSDTTGVDNVAHGSQALYSNTTGSANVALGAYALYNNTTTSGNIAIGYNAGRYLADGSTALTGVVNSIYIGTGAMGLNNNDNNSIVIGYNAIGLGSNTVVLGNVGIETTALRGNVGIGTTVPQQRLEVRGGSILGTEYALTAAGTITVNWSNGNQQYVTLNQAGHTINFSNYKVGQVLRLIVCQDSPTGSRTVTAWDSSIVWASGNAPTLTTTAGKCDMISFVCNYAKGSVKNFGTVTANF